MSKDKAQTQMGRHCLLSQRDLCAFVLPKKVMGVHCVRDRDDVVCARQNIHFKLSLKISAGSRHLILFDKTKITPLFWELHVLLSLMGGKISKKLKVSQL